MAGISPTNVVALPVSLESQGTEGKNHRIFKIVGSAFIQLCGKPILAIVVCVVVYPSIDRFSSPPSSTLLKVILVVGTLGFIAYHMISQIIEVMSQSKEIKKQADEQFKVSTGWTQDILLEVGDGEVFYEAFKTSMTDLQSRQQILSENPVEIDEGDTIKMVAVSDFNDKMSKLRKDFDEISQSITSELSKTTMPKDYKDVALLMPEQTERRTKMQEAKQRQLELLQQMIACYDEILTSSPP
jgi:hypothetical protein